MTILELIGLAAILFGAWWAAWFSLYCYLNARSLARAITRHEQISWHEFEWTAFMTALSFIWNGVPLMWTGITKTRRKLVYWRAKTIKQHWLERGANG